MRRMRAWFLGLAVAAIAIAYAILSHLSNSTPNAGGLGVLLAVTPVFLIAVMLAWRSRHRLPMLVLCAIAAMLVERYWPLLTHHFSWLYLLQQVGAYVLLGLSFGNSLRPGRTPLCTRWATAQHGALSPAAVHYTRAITLMWTVAFAALTVALIMLFLLAPLPVWSAFANFATLPLMIVLFIVEYAVRGRALPDMQHAGILVGMRAYWDSSRGPPDVQRGKSA